jgi:hypothetical protein
MSYTALALGLIGSFAGAFGAASAAEKRKKRIGKVAATPGVDIGDVTADNLQDILGNADLAALAGRQLSLADQATLNQLLESSMPGYAARQAKQASLIDSYLAGEIPEDVARAMERSNAAWSVGGGYSRSPFERNRLGRNIGLTSYQMQQQAMNAANQFATTTRNTGMAPLVGSAQFAGITPAQAVNLRSKERTEMMQALLGQALAPSGSEVWSAAIQNISSGLMGAGSTGQLGQGWGFGGGGVSNKALGSIPAGETSATQTGVGIGSAPYW